MKLKKYITSIVMMTLSLALTVGCSSSENNDIQTSEVKQGEEVVVATSVAVTEILDKLGVKVSGVPTTSYELPESVKNATEVGSPMNPDMEIIKSLNPTVVVSVDTLGEDYKKTFTQNNIPSEFVNLTNVDGLKETIKTLGERFDKNDKANEILKELEDKVDQFHHYMVCYKNADQNELKEQLDSLNRVILEEDQQLKQKLHYSKSEVAFRIGMAYEEVENIIRDLKKDLKRMSEASSLDEFDAEKAALLAEYMMDFAMQTSDYALLSVMKANDAQLRLEEKEA